MKVKLTILAVLATTLIYGQDAAKPESKAPAAPPVLSTSKLWRLLSKAQTMRQQLNESPQGKEAIAAEAAVQSAQKELQDQCGAAGLVLGFDADEKSKTFQDLTCVKAPPPAESKGK